MPRLSRNTPSLLDGVDETPESPRADEREPTPIPAIGDDPTPELPSPAAPELREAVQAAPRKRAPALDTDAGRRERRRFAEDLASRSIKGAIKVLQLAASGGTAKRGVKITPLQVDAAKQIIELSAGKTPAAELDKGLKRVLIADQPKPGTPDAKMLRCTCTNCRNARERVSA